MRDRLSLAVPLVVIALACCLAVGAAGSQTNLATATSPAGSVETPSLAQSQQVTTQSPSVATQSTGTASDRFGIVELTGSGDRVRSGSAGQRVPAVNGSVSHAAGSSSTTLPTADLEVEAATSGDSDSEQVSFTFRVGGNANTTTNVFVSPSRTDRSYGDLVYEFVGWSDMSGSGSGDSTSWTATGGHRYRVTYEVTAYQGVSEGTYAITASATTGDGTEYSDRIEADVEVREPEFAPPGGTTVDAEFGESTGSEVSGTFDISVTNQGDGTMVLDSASVGNTPAGITASVSEMPDQIGAGDSRDLPIDISVQESVEEGTHEFSVGVRDNLGNTVVYDVTVRVEKLPALSADSRVIDLGEVLVGRETTESFTLQESAGYVAAENVVWELAEDHAGGSISLDGLEGSSVPADGTLSQDVTVSASDSVQQGEQLRWTVNVYPESNPGGNARVTFTASVIYPAYYDGLSVGDASFVFDRPREEVSDYSQTVTLRVRNGGDLPMDVEDVAPTVDDPAIDATVVDSPTTIDPRSSATVDVRIDAGTDATEGEHTLSVAVDSADAGRETVSSSVSIDRRAELAVADETLSFGEVIVTRRASRATVLSETLGYEDVRDFQFERVSGPDRGWLTVVERPSGVDAGASGDVVLAVTFDPNATLYETYNWTFRVSGSNVETRTISVSGVPRPIDFSQIRTDLGDLESGVEQGGDVAAEMNGILGSLEEKLQADEAPRSDIVAVSTAGQSTVLFLESADTTRAALDDGNHSAAQRRLIRTSAAFRTLDAYTGRISNEELAQRGDSVSEQAASILSELTERQRTYYEEQLQSPNTTMLERADIKRDLARLAALRGEQETAERLRGEADRSFANYSTLVAEGNERLQTARSQRNALDESLFLSVFGQRVFWIGSLDRYGSETEATLTNYETAEQRFRTAGATERAEVAAAERSALAASYEQARTVSLAIGGVLGLVFLVVVVLEGRALYRYVLESRAAVSGDFLV